MSDPEAAEKSKMLLERLRQLEAEKSSLVLENETQRQQYERCLDEIANQVVQALLTQKVTYRFNNIGTLLHVYA